MQGSFKDPITSYCTINSLEGQVVITVYPGLLQSRHCEEAERLKQSPNEQEEIASAQKAGLAMTSDGLSMDNATALTVYQGCQAIIAKERSD